MDRKTVKCFRMTLLSAPLLKAVDDHCFEYNLLAFLATKKLQHEIKLITQYALRVVGTQNVADDR